MNAAEPPFQGLPRAALSVARIKTGILSAILALAVLALLLLRTQVEGFADGVPLVLQASLTCVLLALFLFWTVVWTHVRWNRKVWRLTSAALELHAGVIIQRELTVPRSRIQHTEVTQGPLQRRFGLATLTLYTAGERFADLAVAGLADTVARELRDELLTHSADHVV